MDCQYLYIERRGDSHYLKCANCGHDRTGPYCEPWMYHRRCPAALSKPMPIGTTPILFRFRYGLGDCIQAAVVLRHLKYLRPDLIIDVQSYASMQPIFAGLCRTFFPMDEQPTGQYEVEYNVPWPPHPDSCYTGSPSTKAEKCLREVHGVTPRPDLWKYQLDVPADSHRIAAEWLAREFGEPTLAGKLMSFGRALASLAKDGKASAEEKQRRLSICETCEQLDGARCRACGCAITLKASIAATKCPLGKWESKDGRVKAALIHYRGASFRENKDLPRETIERLCRVLSDAGLTPIVLDDAPVCEIQGVKHIGGQCPDPTVLAALAGMVSLCVGIDSGPEHVWACTDTPTIVCWTKHHPLHYFVPAENVLHLVPTNQRALLGSNAAAGEAFFRDHYRHQIYLDLEESLCTAARQALGFKGREITLNVPQGLGDLLWPVLLSLPHFDRINLNMLTIGSDAQQFRSCEWPQLLPKVGAVNFRLVHSDDYGRRANTKTTAAEIVERWEAGQHEQDLACNGWLEAGNRLEALGEPQWEINAKSEPCGQEGPFVCLAVSGDTVRHPAGLWTIHQWLDAVDLLYRRYEWTLPIVLLGADFDRAATEPLAAGLRERGYTVNDSLVSNTLCARKVDAVKRCSFFLGYQSGLNVLADLFDRPQLMVFFDRLEKMVRTFAKPANLEVGLFNAALFRDGPEAAIGSIRWPSFADIWREVEGVTLYDSQRARLLWECCLSLPSGDVLEVGAYRGGTARLLARALPRRTVWTCESFEGLRPGERDCGGVAGRFADCDPVDVRTYLPDNARLLAGRFPETAPDVPLALLHFDADLYEPCKAALAWAWPRLAPGGVVFLDDYGRPDCPGVKAAADEFGLQVQEIPDLCVAIARKPWTS